MAKRGQQKLKLLYLLRILQERTDEEHPMPMAELIAALADAGIEAERKSLYDDLEALRVFGADVQLDRRAGGGYFLGERPMELAELKLLVDAVQCSRFITEKKSARSCFQIEPWVISPTGRARRMTDPSRKSKLMRPGRKRIVHGLRTKGKGAADAAPFWQGVNFYGILGIRPHHL